ncbi:hypothetical protein [Scytonema sp. PCC 10023]|uniref:hypothetical protein n=1 Tax=Scytonema sp. PCC 10023 TaxID=1680591 RepID=UPI0039C76192
MRALGCHRSQSSHFYQRFHSIKAQGVGEPAVREGNLPQATGAFGARRKMLLFFSLHPTVYAQFHHSVESRKPTRDKFPESTSPVL